MSAHATTTTTDAGVARPWIESARFDLLVFFAAAALGLALPGLAVIGVVSPLAVVWVYVLFFDGPHMMAGYTRTFMDKVTRREHPRLLYGTLAAGIVVPLGSAALSARLGNDAPFQLFLGAMTLYSFWHIVRQGWGIFALYRSRDGARANVPRERASFYAAMYAPYIYFLFTHPGVRAEVGAPPLSRAWEHMVARALVVVSVAALASFVARVSRAKARVALAYGTITIFFHAAVYFALAVREPVFPGARGTDQTFMIMTAAVSICHSTQYVALVFIHNARRYRAGSSVHGVAGRVSAKARPYVAACLAFALPYACLTWATGIYPSVASPFGGAGGVTSGPLDLAATLRDSSSLTPSRIALAVYWGIALQHYLLDARIWRIRTDPALRDVFRAAPSPRS